MSEFFKTEWRTKLHWLRVLSRRDWLLVIIPLTLLFAILVGAGSFLQHFAYSQLEGGPPTVQEAALGEAVKDPSSKKFETSLFFSASDQVVRKAKGPTEFFLHSVLLTSEDRQSRPTARSFVTDVGTGPRKVMFQPHRLINPKRKLRCQFLDIAASQNGVFSPDQAGFVAGIYVRLIPVEGPLGAYRTFDNELILTGFGGQVGVGGMSGDDIDGKDLGSSDFVAVSKGLTSLKVDDVEIPTKRDDGIYALGHISANREAEGAIRFTGAAQAAWKNGSRLNKSRWERLSTEWQLAVLGWIGGLLFGLSRLWPVVAGRLRQETPFAGLAPLEGDPPY